MNNIKDFSKCSNCGACYNACTTNAISVNEEGMYYSLSVDDTRCVSCGVCKKVCPVNAPMDVQNLIGGYAGCHIDENVVSNSSSGGAFYALANVILADGGVVYSATYGEDNRSVVMKSTDEVSLTDLLRSKYVESMVSLSFRNIKKQLEEARKSNSLVVYFSHNIFPGAGHIHMPSELLEELLAYARKLNMHIVGAAELKELRKKYSKTK